jgi:hypothetical protein
MASSWRPSNAANNELLSTDLHFACAHIAMALPNYVKDRDLPCFGRGKVCPHGE